MDSVETILLQALAAHPGWMSLKFLAAATQRKEEELLPSLTVFQERAWVEWNDAPPQFYRWIDAASMDRILGALSPFEREALHRRIADFLEAQAKPESFAGLLSFHHHQIAAACLHHNRFQEALDSSLAALAWAEQDGGSEILELRLGDLANLYFHLGRFQDSEPLYRRALEMLQKTGGPESARIRALQSLAAALVEQGKYAEALPLLEACRSQLGAGGSPLELAVTWLHLAQIHVATGMPHQADRDLKAVEALLSSEGLSGLQPYLELLRGKLEIASGRLAAAFRILEQAASGLEAQNDLAGKLEVLLSVSAPLLEHSLVREAQNLIDQVATWEELKGFPALEHSVHLRRLALGAFSGIWVQADLELLAQDDAQIGSAEDWLLFWFHLSLAARRLGNHANAEIFSTRARRIVERIAKGLPAELRESFLRRPDVARICRLSESKPLPARQKIRARRSLVSGESAEAATMAPPRSDNAEK